MNCKSLCPVFGWIAVVGSLVGAACGTSAPEDNIAAAESALFPWCQAPLPQIKTCMAARGALVFLNGWLCAWPMTNPPAETCTVDVQAVVASCAMCKDSNEVPWTSLIGDQWFHDVVPDDKSLMVKPTSFEAWGHYDTVTKSGTWTWHPIALQFVGDDTSGSYGQAQNNTITKVLQNGHVTTTSTPASGWGGTWTSGPWLALTFTPAGTTTPRTDRYNFMISNDNRTLTLLPFDGTPNIVFKR